MGENPQICGNRFAKNLIYTVGRGFISHRENIENFSIFAGRNLRSKYGRTSPTINEGKTANIRQGKNEREV